MMNEFLQSFNGADPTTVSTSVKLFLMLTVLAVAPGILILMTSFTRIIIVLSFVRTSLATQQMPPNQVLLALAMFMTFLLWHQRFKRSIKLLYHHFLIMRLH